MKLMYRIWDPARQCYYEPTKEPWRWRTLYNTVKVAEAMLKDGDTDSPMLVVVDDEDRPAMEVRK